MDQIENMAKWCKSARDELQSIWSNRVNQPKMNEIRNMDELGESPKFKMCET